MSLDVMEFLKEDFFYKYNILKLQSYWSRIDEPLRRLFIDYHSLLQDIDIASLQGEHPDLLYFLNCAVDDCLVESAETLHSVAKRSFKSCRKSKGVDMKRLEYNLTELRYAISKRCWSSVRAPHKPASIPLLNYKVHGFEKQLEFIVNKIRATTSDDYGGSCAVGIVGIGGSGKTTLASMVFNAREVREKYQIMIWASLTSTLNKKESSRCSVFREILSGVENNDSLKTMLQKFKSYQGGGEKMGDHVLDKYIDQFKETLKRNSGKYLLVLDDVWETEYWFSEKEEPKCILSLEWIQKTGGTIVVTSRLEEMAENIVGKRDLYMIPPVSDEACCDIFLDRATKDGYFTLEDEHLKNLKMKEIADKCFGLPLAACTVADIFVAEHREEAEKAAMKEREAAKDKAVAEGGGGFAAKDKTGAEEEGDTSKAKEEAEGTLAKDKIETEGDTSKPRAESDADGSAAKDMIKREGDTSKPREEADAEGSAAKDKLKAEGEGDTSKPRAEGEVEGEASAKDKTGVAGDDAVLEPEAKAKGGADQKAEVDASEPKVEAEKDVMKAELAAEEAKAKADGSVKETAAEEAKAEADGSVKETAAEEAKAEPDGSVKETAAEEAKAEADSSVKETAPESSKAEEQAETEAGLPSHIDPARKLAQRVIKAFKRSRETKRKTSEPEPRQ